MVKHVSGVVAVVVEVGELGMEHRTPVQAPRVLPRDRERARRVDRDDPGPADGTGAEADRRLVAFADAANTHYERDRAVVPVGLRVRHRRRVAERRAFDRVLVREAGTKEQDARLRKWDVGGDPRRNHSGMFDERFVE